MRAIARMLGRSSSTISREIMRRLQFVAMGHFLEGVSLVAKHLHLEEGGYRVVINNGKDAM